MNKMFESLCTPAKIYLIIAVFACVVSLYNKVMFVPVFMKLLFALLWTYILGWLCKKGFTNVSWFLVLFPYVVILLAALCIVNLSQYNSMFSSVGLQGAYGQEGMENKPKKM